MASCRRTCDSAAVTESAWRRCPAQSSTVLGPEHAGVRVLWLPTPECPAIDKDATALEFKRRAYWHNDRRNDYIAAVARAFDSMDAGKLRKYGVPFRDGQPAMRNAPKSIIMVLAASTEQGRELLKRLPGWKLFTAVRRQRQQGGRSRPAAIVTETRAAKSTIDADVLIRAGGSAGTAASRASRRSPTPRRRGT